MDFGSTFSFETQGQGPECFQPSYFYLHNSLFYFINNVFRQKVCFFHLKLTLWVTLTLTLFRPFFPLISFFFFSSLLLSYHLFSSSLLYLLSYLKLSYLLISNLLLSCPLFHYLLSDLFLQGCEQRHFLPLHHICSGLLHPCRLRWRFSWNSSRDHRLYETGETKGSLYCTVLYCTVLYCTLLYCTLLYCTLLYFTVLYCIVFYCTVLYCTVLYCTVLYCTVLYCTVLYCTVLYCTVLYCTCLCERM